MRISNKFFPLLLIGFILCFDFIFGNLSEELYFSEESKENNSLVYSATKANDELIIFGSSRAKHHYNVTLIQDSLDLKSYNFGSNGQNIYFHNILLKNLLNFHSPKIILLELMNIDFQKTKKQWNKEKLNVLVPLTQRSSIIDEEIGEIDNFHFLKSYSKSYLFNSTQYTSLRNYFSPSKKTYNGYQPLKGNTWNKKIEIIDSSFKKDFLDSNKVNEIYNFIELCQNNDISVFVFISPSFRYYSSITPYDDIVSHLKEKYDIEIMSFINHPEFTNDANLFRDPNHLISSGANKYSKMVVDSIRNKISEK